MTSKKLRDVAKLVSQADLIMLQIGDKRAALGKDIQNLISDALTTYADLMETSDDA